MTREETDKSFWADGFLGDGVAAQIPLVRRENIEWFTLAEDMSRALQEACCFGLTTAKGDNYDPKTVATRLLLRSTQSFQGVVIMAERGMVAEAQTLARSLSENAFCLAALISDPADFLARLKADADASRKAQGKFLIAQGMVDSQDAETKQKLQDVIDTIGKSSFMRPSDLAALGPLVKQYLSYQKLSNDAAHPSAASLHRHVMTHDGKGWHYRWGIGSNDEISFSLNQAILAAAGIGIGYTQLMDADDINATFAALMGRMQALPATNGNLFDASRAA